MKKVINIALCAVFVTALASCGGQSHKEPAPGTSRDSSSGAMTSDSMVNNSAGEPRILDTTKRGDSALKK